MVANFELAWPALASFVRNQAGNINSDDKGAKSIGFEPTGQLVSLKLTTTDHPLVQETEVTMSGADSTLASIELSARRLYVIRETARSPRPQNAPRPSKRCPKGIVPTLVVVRGEGA